MTYILWPYNDQPASSGQKTTAVIVAFLMAFLVEWIIKTIN